jgi:hypothetical protein
VTDVDREAEALIRGRIAVAARSLSLGAGPCPAPDRRLLGIVRGTARGA